MVVDFFDLRFIFTTPIRYMIYFPLCRYAAFLDACSFALAAVPGEKLKRSCNELPFSETSVPRMTLTEQCARFATAAEVLPKNQRLKPRRSLAPRTIRSVPQCLARLIICRAALPAITSAEILTGASCNTSTALPIGRWA